MGDGYYFDAAPGERNAITIEPVGAGFRLTDAAGAPTGDCTQESATSVLCDRSAYLVVHAGDGDDRVEDPTSRATVSGDAGDDTLVGGPGNDVLVGGPGRDVLQGGAGNDRFVLDREAGDVGADAVDGGPGSDTAVYEDRTAPVRVDLAHDRGPEGDVLAGIEHALGGHGDDVLIGDGERNRLDGSFGDDRLEGRDGDDLLHGNYGRDTLLGGAGDDQLDGETVDARCGTGHDKVFQGLAETFPRLHADCERLDGEGPILRLRPRSFVASWNGALYGKPCHLRVTVDGRRVAAGRRVPVRRPATVRVRPVGVCDRDYDGLPEGGAYRLLP